MQIRFPWEPDPAAGAPQPGPDLLDPVPAAPRRRGRPPAGAGRHAEIGAGEGAGGWLFHHLIVSGPATTIASFMAMARGAGVVPWRLDGAELEERVFVQAVSQPPERRGLSVAGCRILARQFRDRAEAHHAKAVALVGVSRACPPDLHALLPVPDPILALGPTHPDALAWLRTQWGVTDGLRQARLLARPKPGGRLPAGQKVIGYGFFTAAPETPQPAIATLESQWPALRFWLTPRPAG